MSSEALKAMLGIGSQSQSASSSSSSSTSNNPGRALLGLLHQGGGSASSASASAAASSATAPSAVAAAVASASSTATTEDLPNSIALLDQGNNIELSSPETKIDLHCTPLAKIQSSLPPTDAALSLAAGQTVAASRDFICYVVKQTMVRVLFRRMTVRALLKQHTAAIRDLCFDPQCAQRLVTVADDASLCVWQLSVPSSAEDSCSATLLLQVKLPSAGARAVFSEDALLAVSGASFVALLDMDHLLKTHGTSSIASGVDDNDDAEKKEDEEKKKAAIVEWDACFDSPSIGRSKLLLSNATSAALDLAFSPGSLSLALAMANGTLKVLNLLSSLSDVDAATADCFHVDVVSCLEKAHGGAPVNHVSFVPGRRVCVSGGAGNTELALWDTGASSADWKCLQRLSGASLFTNSDETGNVLRQAPGNAGRVYFWTSRSKPLLFVLRLSPSLHRFERSVQINAREPLLSLSVLTVTRAEEVRDARAATQVSGGGGGGVGAGAGAAASVDRADAVAASLCGLPPAPTAAETGLFQLLCAHPRTVQYFTLLPHQLGGPSSQPEEPTSGSGVVGVAPVVTDAETRLQMAMEQLKKESKDNDDDDAGKQQREDEETETTEEGHRHEHHHHQHAKKKASPSSSSSAAAGSSSGSKKKKKKKKAIAADDADEEADDDLMEETEQVSSSVPVAGDEENDAAREASSRQQEEVVGKDESAVAEEKQEQSAVTRAEEQNKQQQQQQQQQQDEIASLSTEKPLSASSEKSSKKKSKKSTSTSASPAAVTPAVNVSLSEIESIIDQKMNAVADRLELSMRQSMNSFWEKQQRESREHARLLRKNLEQSIQSSLGSVNKQVTGLVEQSFRKQFADVLIPGFERAAQEMARQISVAVAESQALVVASVSQTAAATSAAQSAVGASSSSLPSAESGVIAEPSLREQVDVMLAKEAYEPAFTAVMTSASVQEHLIWLCERLDESTVLSAEQPLVSNVLVLTLLQQLAPFLQSEHRLLALRWVHCALLLLRPDDDTVRAHVRVVLNGVIEQLSKMMNSPDATTLPQNAKLSLFIAEGLVRSM